VVVVDHLDEGLDLGADGDLLLVHAAGDALRVASNSSNYSVAVLAVSSALILVVDNNCLAAGEATIKDDDDLSTLEARERERDARGGENQSIECSEWVL
jgi:hypothetical protein